MIATARRAPRHARTFFVLFAISLALLVARDSAPVRAAQALAAQSLVPIHRFVADIGATTSRFFAAIEEIDRLRAENVRLRAELEALTVENVRLRERAIAAEQAAKLQRQAQEIGLPSVPAQVIARDPTGVIRSITLDVGTEQGVGVGHVVVADLGLVGRVTQVGPSYSRVLPITDSASAIAAMVQRSRAVGLVRGQFGDSLILEWILQSEEIKAGDVVLTAGLALSNELRSLYPKGLLIGTIVEVEKAEPLAYQKAVVRPAVDFRRLERVLVVKTE